MHINLLESLDGPHYGAARAHLQQVAAEDAKVAAADQAPGDAAGNHDAVIAALLDLQCRNAPVHIAAAVVDPS